MNTQRRFQASAARLFPVCVAVLLAVPFGAAIEAKGIQRLTVPGINNFWRVDGTVSTGGTITARETAVPALKRRGIRTVIDLAGGADSAAERAAVEKAGMKYLLFAIDGATLNPAPIDPFLAAVKDRTIYPIFIHSGAGHRAAMAWMIKRVMLDGWTIERAGIEAASAGLVDNNAMASVWWKFAQDYFAAHQK